MPLWFNAILFRLFVESNSKIWPTVSGIFISILYGNKLSGISNWYITRHFVLSYSGKNPKTKSVFLEGSSALNTIDEIKRIT